MSLPNARIIRANSRIIPITCITIRNLSLGFLLVTISYKVNAICPPSRAGIGMRFITPSITDNIATILRKLSQFQLEGKIWPIDMKLPTDL